MVNHQKCHQRHSTTSGHVHHPNGHGQQQRSHQTDHSQRSRRNQYHLKSRSKHNDKTQREKENLDTSTWTGNGKRIQHYHARLAKTKT